MKKTRKIFAVVLALVMCLAMALPAMAGTITIKNDAPNHTYKAYQILSGDVSGEGTDESPYVLSNADWGEGVTSAYTSAHTDLQAFLDGLKTAENAKALANELVENTGYLGAVAGTSTREGETYKIEVKDPGYYLVVDESSDEGVLSAYIVEVVKDTIEVDPKTGEPTFEKKVQDVNDSTGEKSKLQDSADYDFGDSVPFTLTATLPDQYEEFEEYYLEFTDDLSDGLTRNNDLKVYVGTIADDGTISGTEITSQFVLTPGTSDPDDFTLVCKNLKAIKDVIEGANITNGSKIIVSYTAVLNTGAVIGGAGNPNTAELKYSRDPNFSGDGAPTKTTPPDKAVVFTYKLDVNKVHKTDDGTNEALAGAAFSLEKYIPGTGWKMIEEKVAGEATKFEFNGLDDGYYRLIETKTPEGYNTIDPIYFEIKAEHAQDPADLTLTDLTATQRAAGKKATDAPGDVLEGSAITFNVTTVLTDGSLSSDVVNQAGSTLPSTGGIGTTIFYVVGICLVVVAGVILVTRKRVGKNS